MKALKRIKISIKTFFLNRKIEKLLINRHGVRHKIYINGSLVLSVSGKPVENEVDMAEILENIALALRSPGEEVKEL